MRESPPLTLTFLGTGTSIGVPSVGCDCPVCRSNDPINQRFRSSIWLRSGGLSWVVDTGPDFRSQCLRAGIRHLDAALFTHAHTDHVMGFDDLRRFTLGAGASLPVHATAATLDFLHRAFAFAFDGEHRYPGYFKPDPRPVIGSFLLGDFLVTPIPVIHGRVETIGYLFSRDDRKLLAYIPDAKVVPEESLALLSGVEVLVLDALRPREHPTHLSISEAVEIVAAVAPRQAWLTQFSCEMDFREVGPALPMGVQLAHDGLELEIGSEE